MDANERSDSKRSEQGSDVQARAYAMANEIVSAAIRAGEIVIGLGEGGKAITERISVALQQHSKPAGEQGHAALVSAIDARLRYGHNDTCGAVLSDTPYPCSCGHDALAAARGQR